MCKHGTYKDVKVIQPDRNNQVVKVDSCIAEQVKRLNEAGVVTIGSCCGHGGSDQYPHILIDGSSVTRAEKLGYRPTEYFHGKDDFRGVYEITLEGVMA